MTGATAVGLLAAGTGGSVAEFHFSADDIEQVFVDARDWQSRFGSSSSPGDRAGRLGDTSAAELVGFLKEGETGDEDEPERDANDPPVWVHEPESVEDITLEGERIQIEGAAGFNELEEDFLEREIAKEIEEQHRAEITGTHRGLDVGLDDAAAEAAEDEAIEALEPFQDLDSTDQFEILHDVPESGLPDQEHVPASEPDAEAAAEPIVPPGTMPARSGSNRRRNRCRIQGRDPAGGREAGGEPDGGTLAPTGETGNHSISATTTWPTTSPSLPASAGPPGPRAQAHCC